MVDLLSMAYVETRRTTVRMKGRTGKQHAAARPGRVSMLRIHN